MSSDACIAGVFYEVLIYHVPAFSHTPVVDTAPVHAHGTTLMQVAGTTVNVRQIG